MKPFVITLLTLFITILSAGQSKPRKIVNPIIICPIDYELFINNGGLSKQKTVKIKLDTFKIKENDIIQKNAKLISKAEYLVADTGYNYYNTAQVGYVFDIVGHVGSFTIVKLWRFSNSDDSDADSVLKKSAYGMYELNSSSYPNRISGIRQLAKTKEGKFDKLDSVTASGISKYKKIIIDPSLDYYLVNTELINANTVEFDYKKGAWNLGLMYLPVKLRPFANQSGFFDFTSSFSLGTSVSLVLKHDIRSDITWNLVLYAGVSSIKIDSASSGTNDSTYKNIQNISAFTPAVGFYWEKKGIQLGLIVGWDLPARSLQKTWVYRNMPWVGISCGINVFNVTNNSNNNKSGSN